MTTAIKAQTGKLAAIADAMRQTAGGTDDKGTILKVQPPSVPTISYLYDEEWERA